VTEAEWLACTDVAEMLVFLHGKASDRKLRLFSVGCIRRGWHLIDEPDLRQAVEVLERFVDGCAKDKDRIAARKTGRRISDANQIQEVDGVVSGADHPQGCLGTELWWVANKTINLKMVREFGRSASAAIGGTYPGQYFRAKDTERLQQKAIVLDIFGNPFRPVVLDALWLTSTVVSLARQMYESRDFSAMPILADALMDAGCENAEVLDHCRGPGPHVRGCWVVDLLLGKG
jgi:hypothetical protein